jgi:flotillin
MNKITNDMTKIAAQIPALFETLSGMRISELLGKVRAISDREANGRVSEPGVHSAEDSSGNDGGSTPSETN